MKKTIIILILLSIISVIGCSSQLDEEILVEILNEQEQEIENLQNQIKELKAENETLKKGAKLYGEKLRAAKECFSNIEWAFEALAVGSITQEQASELIGVSLECLGTFFEEWVK